MGVLNLYGKTIAYEEAEFGMLVPGRDEKGTYYEYTSFYPGTLNKSSQFTPKDHFVGDISRRIELAGMASEVETARSCTGTQNMTPGQKRRALANSRALLKEVKKALDSKEASDS